MANVSCDTNDLIEQAKCFDMCLSPGLQMAVQTYLLSVIAGDTRSPSELADAARCFFSCVSPGEQLAVQNYLLCQIAGAL